MSAKERKIVEQREPVPVIRDEAWLDAYDEQLTDELYDKAVRFASNRAAQIARCGGTADDGYAEDLAQGAFADTYAGTLAWDPSRASLEAHVILAIKCRSRHDRDVACQRRYISFDIHDRGRHAAQTRAEVEASLAQDRREEADDDEQLAKIERTFTLLRDIARSEDADDVITLLDAFQAGARTRADVLAMTSLTAKRYRNARARLATFFKQLPADHASRLFA